MIGTYRVLEYGVSDEITTFFMSYEMTTHITLRANVQETFFIILIYYCNLQILMATIFDQVHGNTPHNTKTERDVGQL